MESFISTFVHPFGSEKIKFYLPFRKMRQSNHLKKVKWMRPYKYFRNERYIDRWQMEWESGKKRVISSPFIHFGNENRTRNQVKRNFLVLYQLMFGCLCDCSNIDCWSKINKSLSTFFSLSILYILSISHICCTYFLIPNGFASLTSILWCFRSFNWKIKQQISVRWNKKTELKKNSQHFFVCFLLTYQIDFKE